LNQLLIEELQLQGQRGRDPAELKERQQRLTAMINDTRTRLEKEKPTLDLTARDAGNSRRRRLETAFEDSAVTLQGLLKQRELRTGTRDDVKKRLVAFEGYAQRLRGLELDATKKRQSADRLAVGLNNLRTIQRLDQLHLSNLQILYPATYLPEKIGPRRSLTLVTGLFLGLVMGVGLAYGLAAFDRCVRRPIDLRQMGLRVQGRIPADAAAGHPTGKNGVAALLAEAGPEIAELWARLPFDRQSKGASIAFVSDTSAADASHVAGVFAAGLALRGGQRVAYVSCCEEPGWLLQRLGSHPAKVEGWIGALHDGLDPGAALQPTEVDGLSIMVQGSLPVDGAHPMQRAEFAAMLARLQQTHDFVIVELPTLSARPEGRAVLRMVDAVIVAAAAGRSTKVAVQAIVDSAVAAGTTLAGATLLD
jgi:Mrp family chromosome partitioning ATPase